MKKGGFQWFKAVHKAFEDIKQKLCQAAILALLNFKDLFELECDTSRVGIGAIPIQYKRPITYFNEKLNGLKCNYSK